MKKKTFIKRISAGLLAAVCIFTLPVCSASARNVPADASFNWSYVDGITGKSKQNNVLKNSLHLSEYAISIDAGDSFKLEAFVSSNISVSNFVEFSSGDSTIAKVDRNGVVTGYTNGSTVITAKVPGSGNTATCTVTVYGSVPLPTHPATEKPTQPATQPPTQQPTTEAPTKAPTQPPTTQPPATEPPTNPPDYTVKVTPGSLSVYKGCNAFIKAESKLDVSFSSSNSSVASVDSRGVVKGISAGTATITVTNGYQSGYCKITVNSGSSVGISNSSASIYTDQSILLTSGSNVRWSSSDTSVCRVGSDGVVYGVGRGIAVVTASVSGGAATCLVEVGDYAPVRFAYASPNSAPKNSTVKFRAITDSGKKAVKFKYSINGQSDWVTATDKVFDGKNCIWTAYATLNTNGTYSVQAYSSKNGSSFDTCGDGETTAFVTSASDFTTTSNERRRASDEIIDVIANYEGFLSELTPDSITGDPTIGYGRVIYSGNKFYNNLTKTEAFAYLVQSVNNDGYAESVNNYLLSHGALFNQRQYDALVCFTYNCGVYALPGDDDLAAVFFNSSTAVSSSNNPHSGTQCLLIGDYVNVRSGPGTGYSIVSNLRINTTVTLVSGTRYTGSGLGWYNITMSDGSTGYICEDYITFIGAGYDLAKVNKDSFISNFLQWHHAGGCIWGLLYRRVDEAEIFLYGDYKRDGSYNEYGINFTCKKNSSFGIYG